MNQVEKKVMLQISRILKLYLCLSFIYLPLNYYSLRGNNQFFMLNIRSFGTGVHLNRNIQSDELYPRPATSDAQEIHSVDPFVGSSTHFQYYFSYRAFHFSTFHLPVELLDEQYGSLVQPGALRAAPCNTTYMM